MDDPSAAGREAVALCDKAFRIRPSVPGPWVALRDGWPVGADPWPPIRTWRTDPRPRTPAAGLLPPISARQAREGPGLGAWPGWDARPARPPKLLAPVRPGLRDGPRGATRPKPCPLRRRRRPPARLALGPEVLRARTSWPAEGSGRSALDDLGEAPSGRARSPRDAARVRFEIGLTRQRLGDFPGHAGGVRRGDRGRPVEAGSARDARRNLARLEADCRGQSRRPWPVYDSLIAADPSDGLSRGWAASGC